MTSFVVSVTVTDCHVLLGSLVLSVLPRRLLPGNGGVTAGLWGCATTRLRSSCHLLRFLWGQTFLWVQSPGGCDGGDGWRKEHRQAVGSVSSWGSQRLRPTRGFTSTLSCSRSGCSQEAKVEIAVSYERPYCCPTIYVSDLNVTGLCSSRR